MDLNEDEDGGAKTNDMESYALQLDDFTGEILKPPGKSYDRNRSG